jgi:hypothetical protein
VRESVKTTICRQYRTGVPPARARPCGTGVNVVMPDALGSIAMADAPIADHVPDTPDGRRDGAQVPAGDIHLILIWATARFAQARILADLRSHFTVLGVFEIQWPRASFERNLARLYGHRLDDRPGKARHCGTGPFLVIVIHDAAPRYGLDGDRPRNMAVYGAKQRYRAWTGGGFRVHGADDRRQSPQHLYLLLGRTIDSFADAIERGGDVRVQPGPAAMPGHEGWPSRAAMLAAIDVSQRHVVLRERPPGTGAVAARDQDATYPDADVELLVEDVNDAIEMIGGVPPPEPLRTKHPGQGARVVVVADAQPCLVELREARDGSFDARWAEHLLAKRTWRAGAYRPAEEDMPWLHLRRLTAWAVDPTPAELAAALAAAPARGEGRNSAALARDLLTAWLAERGYALTEPKDRSARPLSARRFVRRTLRRAKTWARSYLPAWFDAWVWQLRSHTR